MSCKKDELFESIVLLKDYNMINENTFNQIKINIVNTYGEIDE